MPASLHALPDGRHIAVGHHASIAQLDRALADMDPDQHAVMLEQSTLGDHHARVEQELRDARSRIAQLERELATAKGDGWELEDQSYEVVLGHPIWGNPTIYDECDTLGAVESAHGRAFAEMDADELERGPVFTRRITRQFREAQP